jgi:hypothetical protein
MHGLQLLHCHILWFILSGNWREQEYQASSTPALHIYTEDTRFMSQPVADYSNMYSLVFLSHSSQMPWRHLKLFHVSFLPHPLHFIIHQSSHQFDAIQSELLTVSLSTTRINTYNEQQMMVVLQILERGRYYDTNMTKCMGNIHLLSYNLPQSQEFLTMFNFWATFPVQWVWRQCHREGKLSVMG